MSADDNLISAARTGDPWAIRELYEKHVGSVYGLVYRMLDDKQEAEEITQDVFVKAFRALTRFDARSSFKTWCLQIAVNASYDVLRKRKRRAPYRAEWDERMDVRGDNPERGQLMRVDLQYHLGRALANLHEDLRTTFVLRDIEDLSYQEISDVLHCSPGTVASRIARARKQMAEQLTLVGIDAEYLGAV